MLVPVVAHETGADGAAHPAHAASGGPCRPDRLSRRQDRRRPTPGPGAAALREAREEIGLDPAAVAIVGYLDRYLTGTGYRITPVVGRVAPDPMLALNPQEVQEAFEVPLAFLMDPSNHRRGSRDVHGPRAPFL